MKKTIETYILSNNVGNPVIGVHAYTDTESNDLGYALFPIVGCPNVNKKSRIEVKFPIVDMTIPSSSEEELKRQVEDRIDRSSIQYNEGLNANFIIWNGEMCGMVADLKHEHDSITRNVYFSYRGEAVEAVFPSIGVILKQLEFDRKHGIDPNETLSMVLYAMDKSTGNGISNTLDLKYNIIE